MKKIYLISILLSCLCIGCTALQTPEGQQKLDDGIVIAEGVGTTTTALGGVWPFLIPIGTLITGGAVMVKRLKPKLLEAEGNYGQMKATTVEIISTLERVKKEDPALWAKLSNTFEKKFSSTTKRMVEVLT